MNTLEINIDKPLKNLEELFELAKQQFLEYERLEGIEDWEAYDFSIDCSEDQMKFKDMMQIRFIEELTEASSCYDEGNEHFFEEVTDALNFFLSGYIMLGMDLSSLPDPRKYLAKEGAKKKKPDSWKEMSSSFYLLVEETGKVCNLLKNRPWAQTNYLVSILDFNNNLLILWESFWKMMGSLNISETELLDLFQRKFLVNKFRINTGY